MEDGNDPSVRLRQQAEQRLRLTDPNAPALRPEQLPEIVHELQVHQIELEMQNEELCRSQGELEATRDRYAELFDLAPLGYFILDKTGRIRQANLTGASKLDVARPLLVNKSFYDFINMDSRDTLYRHLRRALQQPVLASCELELRAGDKARFFAQLQSIAQADGQGNFKHFLTVISDITERKRAEQALRRSEARLAEAQRLAHIGTWELDLRSNELWWSDEVYRIFEVDPEGFRGSYEAFLDTVYPDDREYVNRVYTESLKNHTPYDIVHRLDVPNGFIKYVNERCETFYGEDGEPVRSIGTVQDITEHVRHEVFLQHQTRRTEALLELPRVAEELDEIAFMQRGLEMAEELTESQISFVHFVNDDEQSIELVTWSRRTLGEYCSAKGESHYPVREAGIWADALRRYEAVVFNDYPGYAYKRGLPKGHAELTRLISLPVIENGKVVMLAGVGNKVTDYADQDVETLQLIADAIWRIVQRRRSTLRLQLNEARYRELVESMTDGVAVYEAVESGRDFVCLEHNRAGERITGMARDRIIGRRLTEAFPKVEALGLLDVLRRVWRTGKAESCPTSLYKDERVTLWVENCIFKLPSGEVVAVYSDRTARKQAEEALQTSRERLRRLAARIEATREEERTAIAREVHDEFGQTLTGLKMDLAWLRDHLADAQTKSFTERLEAAETLADSTLDGMRRLAARLRPSLLDDLGLTAAIEWQVKDFAGRVGCKIELDLTDDDIGLNRERDTAVYRILQEALTNVARHAQATQVTVSLKANKDTLELIVADNGNGIRDEVMESVTSMGLIGMRERAEGFGGQVDVRPRSGGGTQVLLRVPRSNGAR